MPKYNQRPSAKQYKTIFFYLLGLLTILHLSGCVGGLSARSMRDDIELPIYPSTVGSVSFCYAFPPLCPVGLLEAPFSFALDTVLLPYDIARIIYIKQKDYLTPIEKVGDFALAEYAPPRKTKRIVVTYKNKAIEFPKKKECFYNGNVDLVINSEGSITPLFNKSEQRLLVLSSKGCYFLIQQTNQQVDVQFIADRNIVLTRSQWFIYTDLENTQNARYVHALNIKDLTVHRWDTPIVKTTDSDSICPTEKLHWTFLISISPDHKQAVYLTSERQKLWVMNKETQQQQVITLSLEQQQQLLQIEQQVINSCNRVSSYHLASLLRKYSFWATKHYVWQQQADQWQWQQRIKPLPTRNFSVSLGPLPGVAYRNYPYSIYAENILIHDGITDTEGQGIFEYFADTSDYWLKWGLHTQRDRLHYEQD